MVAMAKSATTDATAPTSATATTTDCKEEEEEGKTLQNQVKQQQEQQQQAMTTKTMEVDCIIIGAGAAGLQCAAELLQLSSSRSSASKDSDDYDDNNNNNGVSNDTKKTTRSPSSSVVVLEARPEVGGRIRTVQESVEIVEHGTTATFNRDLGAAWVHGIGSAAATKAKATDFEAVDDKEGLINPMVELLLERKRNHRHKDDSNSVVLGDTNDGDFDSLCRFLDLDPIFIGNPETRPETVLLNHPNTLVMYLDGKQVSTTAPGNAVLKKAIDRHYDLLQKGEAKFFEGPDVVEEEKAETKENHHCLHDRFSYSLGSLPREQISVENMINHLLRQEKAEESNNNNKEKSIDGGTKSVVKTLTNASQKDGDDGHYLPHHDDALRDFFRFILTNWHGVSLRNMQFEFLLPTQTARIGKDGRGDGGGDEGSGGDSFYAGDDGDYEGPHCKVHDGMIAVLEPLLDRINSVSSDVIQCNKKVVRITDDPNRQRIRVETDDGSVFEAKCCVCTIPLGCLKHHTSASSSMPASSSDTNSSFFVPPLDPTKMEGIHSLWSGSYKKVFMTFNEIFWPVEPPSIGLALSSSHGHSCGNKNNNNANNDEFPGNYLLLTNVWAKHGVPCLEAALCGDMGEWALHKSDDEIQRIILDFVGTAMGVPSIMVSTGCDRQNCNDSYHDAASPSSTTTTTPPVCLSISVTRWEEDEFTRGAYTTYQLGTRDDHAVDVQRPTWDGRLLFAGEHTELEHMGSVHGALISGKRIARQIRGSSILTSTNP